MDRRNAWLALSKVSGVSTHELLKLVKHYGSPQEVMRRSDRPPERVPDMCGELIKKAYDKLRTIEPLEEEKLLNQAETRFITFEDEEYPKNLKEIYDPPLVLYIRGRLLPRDGTSVAIVGARKASSYGRLMAHKLARELSDQGITVVSGLARGIDAYAHRGAIEGKGRTVGVLGCGVDIVYPPEHRDLQNKVEESGAVISEFSPETPPLKYNFPSRNRIIAGMTLGTVVVEAGAKSGALITAEFALDSGREVFAVPGSATSELSRGPHRLIKEGAFLVENVKDILSVLDIACCDQEKDKSKGILSNEDLKIIECLSSGGKRVSQIVEDVQCEPRVIMAQISRLEMRGVIKRGPGNIYNRA